MKIAVFGGSFDPPHVAHVMACGYALSVLDVDRVLMVPCARHPFGKPMAAFAHRLAMCRLAVEVALARVEVSNIEGRREGVSYMVDTLDDLIRQRPGDSFALMIGSDILGETSRWKDFDRIQQLASLLVIPRLGGKTLEEAVREQRFVLPQLDSTRIRARLAAGELPRDLLPRAVADYIAEHGLYGYRQPASGGAMGSRFSQP